ncbi:MAG: SusC/RagA family TonB-linked outer membrane protein [Tannerellaceae bacterium]|nr:SusC/RagA family TonB-linked outer membrane protein [Tannerellaceae bacterium]
MQLITAQISLTIEKQSVRNVIREIERISDYRFFYNEDLPALEQVISLKSTNASIQTVLDQITKQAPITYILRAQNQVVLSAKTVQESDGKRTVSGVVIDEEGEPVIGANVILKGTSQGSITGVDGDFSFQVPATGAILQITYLGYVPQEIPVGNQSVIRIIMREDLLQISEVVVTALGIKREEKALGYAVQKVAKDGLTNAKSVDITSSLTGRVAGLNIQNSTEFGEASEILLRGEKPLLIVDGVPYDNMTLNEIAADDIESIDVLKGATASALYGSRGGSGAIMVTTKRGDKEGLKINVNSNTMFFSGYLAFPEVQHSYSAGTGGKYNNNAVWGDKLDIGRTAVMWDPYTYEYREQELVSKGKDNFKNFLQFSMVTNNNVNVTQTGKYGSVRTSLTHVYNRGQYPNQDLNKITYTIGGNMEWRNFKLDASASYNKRKASNISGTGYSGSYIYDMVIWGGTEYDVRDYRNYWVEGKEHIQQNWYDDSWYDNPYFKANEVINSFDTDLFNGALNLTYEFNSWLKAMGRAGADVQTTRTIKRNAISANYGWDKKGYYSQQRETNFSVNADAIVMADRTWDKFNLNVLGGASVYYRQNDRMLNKTQGGLSIPGYYSLYSSVDPIAFESEYKQKRVNSLYGKASFSWASTYFLDVTARNDWSSTLRSDERSYFYPSVSGSVVLSEILPLPEGWNFLKVRGSWTTSKYDAGIYANNNVYTVNTNVWEGLNTARFPSNLIGGSVLPQKAETWEVGTAMNFLTNRLTFDFAYFRKIDSDFIIDGGVSEATGYQSIQTNSKEQRLRQGIEISIGATPVKLTDFTWNTLINLGHDKYTYHRVDPEYSTSKPWVQKGERWDWIAIYDWDRDPKGNIIHNGGIPVKQNFTSKVGTLTPDLTWGWTNTMKYRDFTLSFTLDGRIGGHSYSRTHQMLWNSGAHKDSDNNFRYEEVVNGNNTYIGKGVKVVEGSVQRDPDGNILEDTRVFAENDVIVSYEAYMSTYHGATSNPSQQNILNETFFKLRTLSLVYELPQSICQKIKVSNASIGFTGYNLFLWAKDYKYADPDKGGDSGDSYGYENLNSPSQRYMEFNINMGL